MDVDAALDPEVAEALKAMPRMGTITLDQIPNIRAQRALMPQPELSDAVERTDRIVPAADAALDDADRLLDRVRELAIAHCWTRLSRHTRDRRLAAAAAADGPHPGR